MKSKMRGLLINLTPKHGGVEDKDEFVKALSMAGFNLTKPFLSQTEISTIRTLIYQDDPSLEENILYVAHLERVFNDKTLYTHTEKELKGMIKINCIKKSDAPFPFIRNISNINTKIRSVVGEEELETNEIKAGRRYY